MNLFNFNHLFQYPISRESHWRLSLPHMNFAGTQEKGMVLDSGNTEINKNLSPLSESTHLTMGRSMCAQLPRAQVSCEKCGC